MQATRIPAAVLSDRLDARYNAPEVVRVRAEIASCAIKTARLGDQFESLYCGPFGSSLTADQHAADGEVILIQPTNINVDLFSVDTAWRIPESARQLLGLTPCPAGTLLFARKGIYPHVGVLPSWATPAVIGSSMVAGVPKKEVDPYFLLAFLRGNRGQALLFGSQTITAQPTLNTNEVAAVRVPDPHPQVKAYIGDKVRQAERLRARARALEGVFRYAIEECYPAIFGPIQLRGRTNRASVAELDGDLNPGAFNPERVRIRRYLLENGGRRVDSLATIATPASNDYRLQDAYLGLDGISSSSCMLTLSTVADDEVGGTLRVLSEGPAIGKLRPYLNKVCYVPAEMAGTFGSTELLCVRPNKAISGWFLYGVLKLESSVRQLNPVSTGSTHPRIDRADISELMVPWHEDHEVLGAELAKAQQAYLCAHRLTLAAKLLVEGLIDGHVSEADLQASHTDRDADRAILRRLTAKGLDVTGEPPLFPDLDQLEKALADAGGPPA